MYALHRERRMLKKKQESKEAADKSSKHCQKRQDTGRYSKVGEKGTFAWA